MPADRPLEAALFLIEDVLVKGGFIITAWPRNFVLVPPKRTENFTEKECRLRSEIEKIFFDFGGQTVAHQHIGVIGSSRRPAGAGLRLCGFGTGKALVQETWMRDELISTGNDHWNPRSLQHEDDFPRLMYLVDWDRINSNEELPSFRNLNAIS